LKYKIEELSYIDDTLIYKEPSTVTSSNKDIAIIVHLFYSDIWEEIQTYLSHIDIPYDLYVTVPEGIPEKEIIEIFKNNPDIHIYVTENRGRDVLPFLQIMRIIGLDTYAYLCKMHTKKTGDSALGNVWRKLLYYDLIGSTQTVQNILTFFQDENVGMVTGKNTILDSQRYTYGNDEKIKILAEKTKLIYDEYYLFPAGTMFWTRPEIAAPIVALFNDDALDFEEEAGQKDDTLAHAIERFFGIIAQVEKKEIIESPSSYSKLDDTTLNEVAALVLSQQYVGNNVFASQKQKIEEQNTYIAYLEALAESMRMKNRLKSIVSDKIIPIGQKITKIPSKALKVSQVIKHNPSLLKKVFYYAKRGELGYLITKIKEKSSTNLAHADTLVEVHIDDYFSYFNQERYLISDITIDIIIPVYNGYQFLKALFNSLEEHTTSPYRLIVVNDCSPDEKVKPYLLKRLEKHPTAIFLDHAENQGFLKSVNEAYTYTSNHFLILNTDTEVPKFWMERLMYPILHMDNIASTTPFTNSGEIASFPNFVADNEIFEGMQVNALDEVFRDVNPTDFYAEVPTGVGFCMGVNYHLTKEIGLFLEDTFGKGYGEENDWCQRAIKQGYKNLIVPNLFVYHKHGGSFSTEEKQRLIKENAIKLLDKHPNYGKDVDAYVKKDPHHTLRHLLVLKASNKKQAIKLIFDHALGGGANIYTQEMIDADLTNNKNILLIQYDFYSHCYTLSHRYKTYNFSFKITAFTELQTFINTLSLEEIFINNLVSYKQPHQILIYLSQLQKDTQATLTIPIHDAYTICPSYNLLNEEGKYCDVPSLDTCKTCMGKNMQEWRTFYHEDVDMVIWRTSWGKLINASQKILCFSNASKEMFLRAYPHLDHKKIEVIPHQVKTLPPVKIEKELNKTTITIGILGAINYVKGAHIIKQMVQIIDRDKLDINVVIIGEITESIQSKHFQVTGKYERDNLPKLIKENHIDVFLIPSVWPETFSYTTQEVMMMELPLMVFNLGAPAERVKKYKKGYIIDEISANAILETIQQNPILSA